MRHVTFERVQYLRKSTHVQEEEGSIVNEYNVLLYNYRKVKTCNEIGMLPSVRNVTEVLCFPFRSRNINICMVSDHRACNI